MGGGVGWTNGISEQHLSLVLYSYSAGGAGRFSKMAFVTTGQKSALTCTP